MLPDSTAGPEPELRVQTEPAIIVVPAVDRYWLNCPACRHMYNSPHMHKPCGHSACRSYAIGAMRSEEKTCPRCSGRINGHLPNPDLDRVVGHERVVNEGGAEGLDGD